MSPLSPFSPLGPANPSIEDNPTEMTLAASIAAIKPTTNIVVVIPLEVGVFISFTIY
jgi:hypothetical protein